MRSPILVKINSAGIQQLLKGAEIQADLKRRGAAIATRAQQNAQLGTDDFVVDTETGPHRARVAVVTATADAMVAEATTQALTRAVDAGR